MSDQPPSRPQPSRPQTKRPPQGKGRPALSYESRFIGYLVLGFGVLAVIAVVIIMLSGKSAEVKKEDVQQTLVPEMIDTQTAAPAKPKPELYFKREPDLDTADLKGAWQTSIGKFTAVVQFEKDVYQIILAQADPNAPRLYSSGTYKVLEDIVLLTPRLDWPQPLSPKGKIIPYEVITRAPFPLVVFIDGDKMLWQNPPPSEKRVLVPFKSPIFMDEKVDYVTWKKLD